MNLLKHKAFLIAYLAIVLVVSYTNSSWRIYKDHPYQFVYGTDVNQYYGYLPQTFIHNDPAYKKNFDRKYWLIPNENGINLPKMTLGMSIMYLPGFTVGHIIASNTSYEADGYSLSYSISLIVFTFIYVTIALYLLYLCLLRYFKPSISAVSIVLIFISTNLYYYTLCEGEMTHSYLFVLFSVIIFNTIKWFENFKTINLLFTALALGMAILIRPTSVIVGLFPLLYGIQETNFIVHLKHNWKSYSVALLLLVFPFFIQMLYWKIYGGTWLNWSYGDEKFYFQSAHIIDFLVSYRKGWLLYTPLMIFALIGLFWLPKKIPAMKWSIALMIILAVYILSSWWSWWFGGSFGSRAMVEFYAFLIFPLAVFIERIAKVKYLNYGFIAIFMFTTFYNILGTHKKSWWQLHWDSMTKEAFWITFSEIDVSSENHQKLEDAYRAPDDEYAKKGLPERERHFLLNSTDK